MKEKSPCGAPFCLVWASAGSLAHLVLLLTVLISGAASASGAPKEGWTPPWSQANLQGGDVRSLALASGDPDLVAAGTSAGQVFLSRDGGGTWAPAGRPLPLAGWVVTALLFDAQDDDRLWAAGRGIWGGGAVFLSDNQGASWSLRSASLPDEAVYDLVAGSAGADHLIAGLRSGVWETRDGGETWAHLSAGVPGLESVSSLLIPPGRPETIIAGTWRRAFRSDDGGQSWQGIFKGMVLDSEVFDVVPVPGLSGHLWASTCGWVYRSADLGESWTRVTTGFQERRTPAMDALENGRLLAGTVAGLYVSDNGGRSYERRTDSRLVVSVLTHHPLRPERVLVGTEGSGVWRSLDGGVTFSPSNDGLTAPRIAALASWQGELAVAVSHSGPSSGIYRSRDGGTSFLHEQTELPTVLDLAFTQDGAELWAATEGGLFVRREGRWDAVRALAGQRIETIRLDGGIPVAQGRTSLFEVNGSQVTPIAVPGGSPVSVVWRRDELWVSSRDGLYRVASAGAEPLAVPISGGDLVSAGGRVFLAGSKGLWSRTDLNGPWEELAEGRAALFDTGEASLPVVATIGNVARLFPLDRETFQSTHSAPSFTCTLPFPSRDLSAAVIHDGRLFVGTAGYGLLVRSLDELAKMGLEVAEEGHHGSSSGAAAQFQEGPGSTEPDGETNHGQKD